METVQAVYFFSGFRKHASLFAVSTTKRKHVIVRQMEEFSDSLPASQLEQLWLVNTFVCMHLSSVSLTKKRTRQQQFPIFFTSSLYEDVFIQHTKNNEFKNRNEN